MGLVNKKGQYLTALLENHSMEISINASRYHSPIARPVFETRIFFSRCTNASVWISAGYGAGDFGIESVAIFCDFEPASLNQG